MSQTAENEAERASKAAEEQNKRAQEEARKQIDEENERRLQAQRDAVGKGEVTSTKPFTFQEAAKATEALNQPPSVGDEKLEESDVSSDVPPPSNVMPEPLPASSPVPPTTTP